MGNKYTESGSLEESLSILDLHKEKITLEEFQHIKSLICCFAIESMYLDEKNIIDAIKIIKKEKTASELIEEDIKEYLTAKKMILF